MTRVLKSESVMTLADADDDVVGFANGEVDEDTTKAVSMTRSDWIDFGRPSVITVTIVPGDLLNTEGKA